MVLSRPQQLTLPLEGAYGLLLPDEGRREGHARERALHAAILLLEGASCREAALLTGAVTETARTDGRDVASALRRAMRDAGLAEPPRYRHKARRLRISTD